MSASEPTDRAAGGAPAGTAMLANTPGDGGDNEGEQGVCQPGGK